MDEVAKSRRSYPASKDHAKIIFLLLARGERLDINKRNKRGEMR
jgi:hypothetical protein